MLRRDYIIEQIEEFGAVLKKIFGLTSSGDWSQASAVATEEIKKLLGIELAQAVKLSDKELFARLLNNETTHGAENRIFMLAQLFKAAGEIETGQGNTTLGRDYFLKGLDLLLDTLEFTAIEARPDFAPAVEALVLCLGEDALPTKTRALLMQHYERAGEFAKAEDLLFAIADTEGPGTALSEFGEGFYQRLMRQSDAALQTGNFSRAEVQSGLKDFRARVKATSS